MLFFLTFGAVVKWKHSGLQNRDAGVRFPLAPQENQKGFQYPDTQTARVAELVYARDLKFRAARHAGSTPAPGTKTELLTLTFACIVIQCRQSQVP